MTSSHDPPIVAVVNPISGGGASRRLWTAVAAELTEAGRRDLEVVESESSEHATAAAAAAAHRGAVTVAVGGDGHVRDVASGVLTVDDAPMAIAAAGRGNDLVRHLGLPTDPAGIARVIADGHRRRLDVLDVTRPDGTVAVAVGNVYAGLDSEATELINGVRWMGRLAYRVAPVLSALRWKPMAVSLTVDGVTHRLPAHLVVIANSGEYGHGLRIVPTASVDSGRIEILVVDGTQWTFRLAALMNEAKTGAHVRRRDVRLLSGTRVELTIDRPLPVHADGDYLCRPPVTVAVRAAALPVLTG
ncbi:diacylglycerol/lipid kinase family protein [Gordonia shandongensis]|uniref:diacylglycerol/lipid kinase family protein n=1 Tax=Gordonia shandongensis TaxID=376351 RepID=UPI000422884D|nr:diacylglycerol kinase family protein [Gordonia shandongensis]